MLWLFASEFASSAGAWVAAQNKSVGWHSSNWSASWQKRLLWMTGGCCPSLPWWLGQCRRSASTRLQERPSPNLLVDAMGRESPLVRSWCGYGSSLQSSCRRLQTHGNDATGEKRQRRSNKIRIWASLSLQLQLCRPATAPHF